MGRGVGVVFCYQCSKFNSETNAVLVKCKDKIGKSDEDKSEYTTAHSKACSAFRSVRI